MSPKTIALLFVLCSIHFVNAQTKYLTVEPNHSTVGFEVPIAGGVTAITGKFVDFDLELTLDDENWEEAMIIFTIQANSINTGIDDRDKDLQGESFFEVEKYPEITFTGKSVKNLNQQDYEVRGDFTMHGITEEIMLPFTIVSADGNTIGVRIETVINRMTYGVGSDWVHSAIPNFLAQDIPVKIFFWTKKDKRKP